MCAPGFFDNDEGVSPIVATLVLIVVAIIGAAAVGLIMGSFSSNVSQQSSTGDIVGSSSITVNVVGPTELIMGQAYHAFNTNNTGVRINRFICNNNAALIAVEKGLADIGLISENPSLYDADEVSQYNLKSKQVGESGICFVTFDVCKTGQDTIIAKSQLVNAYSTGDLDNVQFGWPLNGHYATAIIAETGDENNVMNYLGISRMAPSVKMDDGRKEICNDLWFAKSGEYPVAYMDSSYVLANPEKVKVLTIYDDTNGTYYPATWDNIKSEIMNYNTGSDPNTYPAGLIRPQVLVTKGSSSALGQAYITSALSPTPAQQEAFDNNYTVHVSQVGYHWLLT